MVHPLPRVREADHLSSLGNISEMTDSQVIMDTYPSMMDSHSTLTSAQASGALQLQTEGNEAESTTSSEFARVNKMFLEATRVGQRAHESYTNITRLDFPDTHSTHSEQMCDVKFTHGALAHGHEHLPGPSDSTFGGGLQASNVAPPPEASFDAPVAVAVAPPRTIARPPSRQSLHTDSTMVDMRRAVSFSKLSPRSSVNSAAGAHMPRTPSRDSLSMLMHESAAGGGDGSARGSGRRGSVSVSQGPESAVADAEAEIGSLPLGQDAFYDPLARL